MVRRLSAAWKNTLAGHANERTRTRFNHTEKIGKILAGEIGRALDVGKDWSSPEFQPNHAVLLNEPRVCLGGRWICVRYRAFSCKLRVLHPKKKRKTQIVMDERFYAPKEI